MLNFYTVCVFGAASDKIAPIYKEEVENLGRMIAKNDCCLVYGAGATGCMGAAARGVTAENGFVFGVTPHFIGKFEEIYDCNKLIKTRTMNERKTIMEEHADFFVVVPGGIGTMDELFEIITLKYLEQAEKPIILFNINGFFDDIIALLNRLVKEGFAGERVLTNFEVCNTVEEIEKRLLEEKEYHNG